VKLMRASPLSAKAAVNDFGSVPRCHWRHSDAW
jgi:hypothetical protein